LPFDPNHPPRTSRQEVAITSIENAPDPDSPEFLQQHNPVEKVSPETTADAPATEADLIPTDPTLSEAEPPG
jgi:hypothetical protein